ncbi:MAG: HD domain-containing protein [archaeon]
MDILKLQNYAIRLKTLKRKGWLLKGIQNCESVADHSYGTVLFSFSLASKLKLNIEKCISLASIHDLAESIVSDITPHDGISESKKLEDEMFAFQKISEESGFPRLLELAYEYTKNKTEEAMLVHDADKLEMVMQAIIYQKETGKDMSEFIEYTKNKLHNPESKKIFEELISS